MLQILRTFIFRCSLSVWKKGIHFMASYDTRPPPIFISLYLSPDSLLMAVHPSFRVLQQQPTPILSFWLDFMSRDAEMERYHTKAPFCLMNPFPIL